YFPTAWPRRIYRSPALARALADALPRFAVVHLHSVFLWPTWVAARLATKTNVPYVVSPRGMLIKELISRRSWAAKSAWIYFIERTNLTQAAAIHLTSELEAAELRRFHWQLRQLAVIPNAVDEPSAALGDISEEVQTIVSAQPLVL